MSLILDALNRSRNESEPVPGLDAGPVYLEDAPPRITRWIPWVALGLAMVLIAWLLWDRGSDPEPSAAVEEAVATAPAVAPLPVKPPASEPAARSKSTVSSPPVEPPPARAAPRPAAARENPKSAPALNAAVAKLYKDKPAAAPKPTAKPGQQGKAAPQRKPAASVEARAEPAAPPRDVEQMLEMAQDALREEALEDHPAPFVSALSQPIKDAIPTLLYERHDFSSTPGRSTVVINGKSLRRGGNVGGGVRVEEILSDSVVLKHRDTQFRLRALNSWVNL